MTYEAELWVCTAILNFTQARMCVEHQYTEAGQAPPVCARKFESGNPAHEPAPMESFGLFEFQEEIA